MKIAKKLCYVGEARGSVYCHCMRKIYWLSLGILLFSPFTLLGKTVQLKDIHFLNLSHHTRIIISLTGSFHYRCYTLKSPKALVVDIPHGKLGARVNQVNFLGTPVTSLHASSLPHQILHLVFYLRQMIEPKAYIQKPHGRLGYRLIVDLMSPPKSYTQHYFKRTHPAIVVQPDKVEKSLVVPEAAQEKASTPAEKTLSTVSTVSTSPPRPAVVVIDPGHGGIDPGATGPDGFHEKDIVFAIATDLYDLLKEQPNVTPLMTRYSDRFVPLRGRLHLARKGKADLFIAIHADAYKDPYARGASIFALSQRGATSEAARWLAEKENYSELGGVDLEDKSYMLRSVLIDLSQTATIQDSVQLGYSMLRYLKKVAQLHKGRVEQAPFVVLKSPDIPSLLVETGFISNRREERLLHSPLYQHKVALALEEGVMYYLHQYPPQGTYFSVQTKTTSYVVQKGDTLASIGRRFDMSISALEKCNQLASPDLQVGQRLSICKAD